MKTERSGLKGLSGVVGLDVSLTSTGVVRFSCGSRDAKEPYEHCKLGTKSGTGEIWSRYLFIVCGVAKIVQEDDVVFMEDYAYSVRRNESRLVTLAELGGLVKMAVLHKTGHWPFPISPGTLKKWVCGSGSKKKEDVKLWLYKKYRVEFSTNDECDAFCLADMAWNMLGLGRGPVEPVHKKTGLFGYEAECLQALGKSFTSSGRMRDFKELQALARKHLTKGGVMVLNP